MKRFKLNNQGQFFSTDLIVASVIFLFILSMSMVYSNSVASRVSIEQTENLRDHAALTAANSLLFSTGKPANWHNILNLSNVSSIGLIDSRNLLKQEKIERLGFFLQNDYDEAKDLLGLSQFDLKVLILELQNKQVLFEYGTNPAIDKAVSTINRFALLGNQEVIVQVKVFKK